jgi:hypothetical protein
VTPATAVCGGCSGRRHLLCSASETQYALAQRLRKLFPGSRAIPTMCAPNWLLLLLTALNPGFIRANRTGLK